MMIENTLTWDEDDKEHIDKDENDRKHNEKNENDKKPEIGMWRMI